MAITTGIVVNAAQLSAKRCQQIKNLSLDKFIISLLRKWFVVPASAGMARQRKIPAEAGTTNSFHRFRASLAT